MRHVTLELVEGEVCGLIGPNGAGKTSLVNVISGVTRATSGQVVFGGRRLDRLAPHEIARLGVGRTFQHVEIFGDQTVHTNVDEGEPVVNRGGGNSDPDRIGSAPLYRAAEPHDPDGMPSIHAPLQWFSKKLENLKAALA